jgi:hypothetical protein
MRSFGRGWFNERYRHYLAAKGIKTNRYFQQRAKKALTKEEFEAILSKGGVAPGTEIVPVRRPLSRKTKLEQEEEYYSGVLKGVGVDVDRDLSSIDKTSLPDWVVSNLDRLDSVREQLKRVQGSPPKVGVVGETIPEIREGVYDAYKGRSARVPRQVRVIVGEATDLRKEVTPLERMARLAKSKRLSREYAAIHRVLPRLEERAEEAAVLGKPVSLVTLEDVRRSMRGRKLSRSLEKKEEQKEEEKEEGEE